MALAGGVSIRVPQKIGYLYQQGMILSPDGHCRAFDEKAEGTVPGNGAGIVVLKRLADAVDDRGGVLQDGGGWEDRWRYHPAAGGIPALRVDPYFR